MAPIINSRHGQCWAVSSAGDLYEGTLEKACRLHNTRSFQDSAWEGTEASCAIEFWLQILNVIAEMH